LDAMGWIAAAAIMALVALLALLALWKRSAAGIPTSRFGRFLRVGFGSARLMGRWFRRHLVRLVVGKKRRAELERKHREETARLATETMGNMKGVFMKLGQIVSFMDESVPPEVGAQLRTLQSKAPPMDYEVVARVIRDELGEEPERLFSDFEREPLASASIGQVHRAALGDGTAVVVKVQYPGVDEAIRADLANVGLLMGTIGALTPTLDAKPIAEELRERLLEELDYRLEADNQKLFAELFADDPDVHVPRVYPELSSQRVLVSEYAPGLGFYEFVDAASEEARRRAVLAIRRFVFDSIWYHHLFNGDPHPGNYVFAPDGRVTFVDFGCVKRFDPEFIHNFKELNRAYILGDRDAYYQVARRMNFIIDGQEKKADADWLWAYTEWFYQPILHDRPFAIDNEYCRQSVAKIFGDNMRKVNMPSEYLMLNRITFGFNSIMAKLSAVENWRRLSLEYYFGDELTEEILRADAARR
jgi:predicted unusual protein kinase regulating ubiquinone biosynthesis (AarF/ABC1/UbiB family)